MLQVSIFLTVKKNLAYAKSCLQKKHESTNACDWAGDDDRGLDGFNPNDALEKNWEPPENFSKIKLQLRVVLAVKSPYLARNAEIRFQNYHENDNYDWSEDSIHMISETWFGSKQVFCGSCGHIRHGQDQNKTQKTVAQTMH